MATLVPCSIAQSIPLARLLAGLALEGPGQLLEADALCEPRERDLEGNSDIHASPEHAIDSAVLRTGVKACGA